MEYFFVSTLDMASEELLRLHVDDDLSHPHTSIVFVSPLSVLDAQGSPVALEVAEGNVLIKSMPHNAIDTLHLTEMWVVYGVLELAETLPRTRIHTLRLYGLSSINMPSSLLCSLRGVPLLELSLCDVRMDKGGFMFLCELLRSKPALLVLSLAGTCLAPFLTDSRAAFTDALPHSMQVCNLSGVGEFSAAEVGNVIATCWHLRDLTMGDCSIAGDRQRLPLFSVPFCPVSAGFCDVAAAKAKSAEESLAQVWETRSTLPRDCINGEARTLMRCLHGPVQSV